ncbi:MAG TPA: hypothetical protein VM597_15555 [Gemmataceae bacterium]|nr:hypothetical protein [Gemmataceae bacterium]
MADTPHPAATPEDARRLAASFADGLSRREDAYTPESLEQADDSVSGYHRMVGLGMLDARMEEAARDVAERAGCYLGEVIVRNLGGRWVPAADTAYARLPNAAGFPLVVELPNGHCCNPLARPFKLLEHGREGESMAGFYAGLVSLAQEPGQSPPPPPRRPWWRFWG